MGTLGDLYPYLALGTALRDHGHSVALAAAQAVHGHIRDAGLEALPCRPDVGPEQVRTAPGSFDHWPGREFDERRSAGLQDRSEFIRTRTTDLLAACRGADVLLHNSGIAGESVAAEILGIPSLRAMVAPERLWNARLRAFHAEMETGNPDSMSADARAFFLWNEACRREAGLPATPAKNWDGYFAAPAILGSSRHFLSSLDILSWDATVCGFWFYEAPQWSDWHPAPELAAFMERRPIVLSLSSQPLADPDGVVGRHVEAARILGRPILVQSGWAGLRGTDSDDVLFQDFLPQDWLFARAACVIHHGGAGTIARAIRNACPMLVEPWGNDQFFNAMMVLKCGVGAAVNPKKARSAELARVIEQKVLSRETRECIALMAQRISKEDGTGSAVSAIRKLLRA